MISYSAINSGIATSAWRSTDITCYYWNSIIEFNEPNTQDVNAIFPAELPPFAFTFSDNTCFTK